MSTLTGIDVSNYQGQVDWRQVRLDGDVYAVAKATEGLSFRDPTFPNNWAGMRRAGLIRGAYHFLRPEYSGSDQADYFHGYVRDSGRFVSGDFVLLDLEALDGQPAQQVVQCAHDFITRARVKIAKPVFLYSGYYFLEQLGFPLNPVLSSCPLWVPSYGTQPLKPPGWPVISFWQYSATGTQPGVPGHVDQDLFYGTLAQLKKLTRGA